MDSLRQRIEGLKKRTDDSWNIGNTLKAIDDNALIDSVLAILDEAMAEKDMPDSEGWWYDLVNDEYVRVKKFAHGQLYYDKWGYVEKIGNCFHTAILDNSEGGGRWYKAILPNRKDSDA